MPNILAIDTSSEVCSLALKIDEELFSFHKLSPRQHTENIMKLIQDLFNVSCSKLSDLDAIAVGIGPGSYTGIRLACSTAQGLAYSQNLPAIAVSSLEIIATSASKIYSDHDMVVLLKADSKHLYFSHFEQASNSLDLIQKEIIEPSQLDISKFPDNTVFLGNGCEMIKELDNKKLVENNYPDATVLISIAERDLLKGKKVLPERILPDYLSDEKEWESKL
tara:strand:- start:28169 stop:28831 length:663 start_codon:yes stop_codon:yes gene_type:complete